MVYKLWVNMFDIKNQYLNFGWNSDEMVWKRFKLRSTRYIFELHNAITSK